MGGVAGDEGGWAGRGLARAGRRGAREGLGEEARGGREERGNGARRPGWGRLEAGWNRARYTGEGLLGTRNFQHFHSTVVFLYKHMNRVGERPGRGYWEVWGPGCRLLLVCP